MIRMSKAKRDLVFDDLRSMPISRETRAWLDSLHGYICNERGNPLPPYREKDYGNATEGKRQTAPEDLREDGAESAL